MAITIDGTNGISSTAISQIAVAGTLKGAVTRSMQSKARDIVSVKDFISDTFNYTLDVTPYFVLAANSVTSATAIQIIVPSGSYNINTTMTGITSNATFIIADDATFSGSGYAAFLNGSVANTKINKNKIYTVNSAPAAGSAVGIYQYATNIYISDGTNMVQLGAPPAAMTDVILAAGTDTTQRTVSALQLKSAGGVGTYASLANFPANFNGVATTVGKLYIGDGTYNAEIPKKDASGALVLNNAATQDTYTVGAEAMVYNSGNWAFSDTSAVYTNNYTTITLDGTYYPSSETATYTPAFSANTIYKITLTVNSTATSDAAAAGSYIQVFGNSYTLTDLGWTFAANYMGNFTFSFFSKTGATATVSSVNYSCSAGYTDIITISVKPVSMSRYPGLILKDSAGIAKISMTVDTNTASMYIGANSGINTVDASYNTSVGINSLQNNISGKYNTALGYSSNNGAASPLFNNGNTTLGYNSHCTYYGNYDVCIGFSSMYNAYGKNEIAIGTKALYYNSINSYQNIAIGTNAMYGGNTSPNNKTNIAIGSYSLYNSTGNTGAIAIGTNSLYRMSASTNGSIAIGENAGYYFNGSSGIIAIGKNALQSRTLAATNQNQEVLAIGNTCLNLLSSGISSFTITNTGSGYTDGYYPNVTLIQYASIISGSITGSVLTVSSITTPILVGQIVYYAGNSLGVTISSFGTGTTGGGGTYNLSATPSGTSLTNTQFTLDNNSSYVSGTSNVYPPRVSLNIIGGLIKTVDVVDCGVGYTSTGFSFYPSGVPGTNIGNAVLTAVGNTVNTANIAVGHSAGSSLRYGANNTILGDSAASIASVMNNSTAIGFQSMMSAAQSTTNSVYNYGITNCNAIGHMSLKNILRASNNNAIGQSALAAITYGSNNIAIGTNAGKSLTTGNNNIYIGTNTDLSLSSSQNAVIIGNGIQYYSVSLITKNQIQTNNINNNIIISDGQGKIALQVDSSSNITTAGNLTTTGNISGGYISQSNSMPISIIINNVTNKYSDTLQVPSVDMPSISWSCINSSSSTVTLSQNVGLTYYIKGTDFNGLTDGGYNTYRATITGTSDGVLSKIAYFEFQEPLLVEGGTVANAAVFPSTMMVPAKSLGANGDAYTISKLSLGNASPTINAFYGTQQCLYGTSGANTYDIAVGTPTGCTLAAYTPTVGATAWTMPAPTAFSADVATVVLTITVRNAAGTAQTAITRTLIWNINRPDTANAFLPSFYANSVSKKMYKSTGGNYIVASSSSYGTILLDTSNYNVISITPTTNTIISANGIPAGSILTLIITTSGTTSYTLTFNATYFVTSLGTLLTGTTTAKTYVIKFVGDGTKFYEISRTAAM